MIHTANHEMSTERPIVDQSWTKRPVEIGADCWIGMGVCILPGARLGDGCVVGGGSVVVRRARAELHRCRQPCPCDQAPLMRVLFLQQQPCVRALKYAAALRSAFPGIQLGFAYQGKTLSELVRLGRRAFRALVEFRL